MVVNSPTAPTQFICHERGIIGSGPVPCDLMIVGIAPGRAEMQSGKPFTGQSGKLLHNILEATNPLLSKDNYYLTNIVCTQNEQPTLEDIIACRPRFQREVAFVRPKLIVLLGMIVTGLFFPDKKFGEVRGSFDYYLPYDCWLLPTNHPAAILHSESRKDSIATDLVNDFKKISQFFSDRPTIKSRDISYHVVATSEEAQWHLNTLPLDQPLALDVETDNKEIDAIDPHSDSLLSLAISNGRKTIVLPRSVITPDLKWPKAQWSFHYGSFDTQALLHIGIDLPIVHDSLLMHFAIDERSGTHKLKPLTRQYEYAGFYEAKIAKVHTNMRAAEPEELYKYNAADAYYTAKLLHRFKPMMEQEKASWAYEHLSLPAVNIFKYMQYRGVPFSRERALDLARKWLPLYKTKEAVLRAMVLQAGGDPDINFDSPQQLSKFLYGTLRLPRAPGGTATATGKDVLEALAGEHPFVNGLIDLRHLVHLLTTYIFGVLDDIKQDGRLHPAPLLHGTVGGRLSYSKPPINTIPRPYMESPYGPELRKLFTADPGHVILELDYRQAEIYMAYFYSQDPMLKADLASGDFHTQTAAFIAAIEPTQVTKEQRFQAKKTNFGKIYLIGDTKLAKQINRSVAEAHVWSSLWDKRYSRYIAHTEELFKQAVDTGEITTVTSRKRRFPIILDRAPLNQIVNFQGQSTSHDYILDSIIQAYWPLRKMGADILLDIHDAILIHAPENKWQEAAALMQEVMQRPRFGFPSVPTEIKVGESWGEVQEVEI